ncbi:MAG TPA: CoA transferase, partial [Acidimicrobiales bacterium]|nr:CoA transferase [Acidimicrobiales bacterium]
MSGNELAGVKVADFSAIMSGPYCTRLMASLGADVVKIEPPNGEHLRTTPPLRAGNSVYFGMLNAGKKSVVIDLRNPEGRRAAEGIIAWADVLIENFRPGVMRKFGLDYESVAQRYPRIVYCSISGYGQDGPWVDRPAVAQVVHAVSGYDMALLHAQGQLDAPLATGPFIADAMAGALAFGGILAGLRARDHTGEGRYVDLSL